MFQANCHPILIGSLPLVNHQQAMQLIFQHSPAIPLWPQLPKNPREGMVRQFLTGFPGLIDQDNRYWVETDGQNFQQEMATFYQEYLEVQDNPASLQHSLFGLGMDSAPGFFAMQEALAKAGEQGNHLTAKGQVTGPVTTGIGVKDQNGNSILFDDNLRDMLTKMLALKGRWQVEALQKFTGEVPPIILIDEPGMVSFGSSGFGAVSLEMVSEAVAEVIIEIQKAGGLAGIHICANGDWGPALSSPADIISFDAYFYFDNFILYREKLTNFIRRGGILAWGIVPTGDPQAVANETVKSLFDKWSEQVEILSTFGFSKKQLMQQTLIAPSCGTGSLPFELAEKVLSMTNELSKLARKQLEMVGKT